MTTETSAVTILLVYVIYLIMRYLTGIRQLNFVKSRSIFRDFRVHKKGEEKNNNIKVAYGMFDTGDGLVYVC